MRINLVISFLAAAAVALTIGCDRKSAGSKSPPESTVPRVVSLVIRYPATLLQPEAWTEVLQQFRTQHTNMQVRVEAIPGTIASQHRAYYDQFRARATDFDLFLGGIDWIGEFSSAGWLRELDNTIPAKERSDFFDGAIEAVSWEHHLYAVPYFVDGTVLYSRTDLLQKAGAPVPTTWADLIRVATEFRQKNPTDRVFGLLWPGQPEKDFTDTVMEFLWGNGGQLLNYTKSVANSSQNRTTLGFVQGLIHRYGVTPSVVTNSSPEILRQIFQEGNALFLRDWASYRTSLRTNYQVALTPLPGFAAHKAAASLDGWFLGINSRTRFVEASAQLLQHLVTEPAMGSLVKASGQSPARPGLYRNAEVLRLHPDLAGLERAFAQARAFPVLPNPQPLRTLLASEFAAVLARTKTPEETTSNLQAQIKVLVGTREALNSAARN